MTRAMKSGKECFEYSILLYACVTRQRKNNNELYIIYTQKNYIMYYIRSDSPFDSLNDVNIPYFDQQHSSDY